MFQQNAPGFGYGRMTDFEHLLDIAGIGRVRYGQLLQVSLSFESPGHNFRSVLCQRIVSSEWREVSVTRALFRHMPDALSQFIQCSLYQNVGVCGVVEHEVEEPWSA